MKQRVRPPALTFGAMIGVVLLFTLQCVGWAAGAAQDAQNQYDRAAALEAQGNATGATSAWQNLLTQYGQTTPTDPQLALVNAGALARIGEAQRNSGQFDAAQATFAQLLSGYPQCRSYCADATIAIAKIYQKKADYLNAIQEYAKVLTDYPERLVQGGFARTRIYEVQKAAPDLQIPAALQSQITSASAAYETAKKKDDDLAAVRKQAIASAKTDPSGAKAALLAQFSDPTVLGSVSHLRFLGIAQVFVKDKDNARLTFQKMMTLAATEYAPEPYLKLRVEAFFYLGDNDTILTESANALQAYGDGPAAPALTYYQARAYDELGRTDDAINIYQSMISRYDPVKDPEDREMMAHALARCGNRLSCLGKLDEAKVLLQRAIDEYPGTASAHSAAVSLRGLERVR